MEKQHNFQDLINQNEVPVLVDFYADWCGPCQMMMPVVEELAGELGDKAKVIKINVDKNQQVAAKYGVRSIPSFMVFKGGKVVGQKLGAMPASALKELVSPYL